MIILWSSATMTVEMTLIDGENWYENEWEAGRTLARDMLAFVRDKLAEHEKDFSHISGIGIYRGPGSFTGLRIGMTVMNTLAETTHVPIVGVTGENWRDKALERLQRGDNDQIVLPEYGGEPHITSPRK